MVQGVVVEEKGKKIRLNAKKWLYNKDHSFHTIKATSIEAEGEKKNNIFVVERASRKEISLEKVFAKVEKFAEKNEISLPALLTPSIKNLLSLLFLMGRKSVVKKLLSEKNRTKLIRFTSNPFLLYTYGYIDFHSAEALSIRTKLPTYFTEKVQSYLYFLLENAYKNGKESVFFQDAVFELSSILDVDEEQIIKTLNKKDIFWGQKKPYIDDERIYLTWIYFLKKKSIKILDSNSSLDTSFLKGIEVSDEIKKLLSYKYTVLTGGAGTGKTTLLKKIKEILGDRCILSALTGKAAQNLGKGAITVHALLGYGPKGFLNKELDCDVLIVDEASMIDWRTLYAILRAAPKVIFCGDPKQLPPIEGENIFKFLIEKIPSVKLEKTWRFSNEYSIDVIKRDTEKKIFIELNKLIDKLKDKNFQIITPIHGGLLGTKFLNEYLQKKLNSEITSVCGLKRGDKVIVNCNIYKNRDKKELVVTNGTIGRITDIYESEKNGVWCSIVNEKIGRDVIVKKEHIDLAYVLTVHKFQGSETDYVIFILPDRKKIKDGFITEEMIRVGKTRGKEKTYILEIEQQN